MLDKRKFYINGAWVNPIDGRDLDVIDPSTEEAVAVISAGGTADTDAAVAAMLAEMPSKNANNRCRYLHRLLSSKSR